MDIIIDEETGVSFPVNRIMLGDARNILPTIPDGSIDLSFWSPPYYVGKSYEKHLTFNGWKSLIRDVIRAHAAVSKPGGFMAVNIADILCFPDEGIPKFQADNIRRKRVPVTREDVLAAMESHPQASRYDIARLLGCSEQTIQRRLEGNNVRGGKHQVATKVMLTGCLVAGWAEEEGFVLYDRRVWHKDPAWMNSRWHANTYRAVDEFEHVYVFWKPGVTVYDRGRLTAEEWSEWGSRGVWRIPSVRRNVRHESEFPVELASRVIRLLCPPGGIVLDPFMGSGSTLVAAASLSRCWLGVDVDERCVSVAERRISQYTHA